MYSFPWGTEGGGLGSPDTPGQGQDPLPQLGKACALALDSFC